ncbi:MAG: cation-translocating P-type ATPase [Chloroflexales bacterium]|nr:cation-translocating P-type ATPase [Chloroflexales bacterium]
MPVRSAGLTQVEDTRAPRGLSEAEARARHARGLNNAAVSNTSRSYGEIIRTNTFNPIHNLLFILGGALVLLGRPTDAIVTLAVIFFNILVGIVQEIRAKRQLDTIALLTRPTARVIRDSVEREAPPDEIVVGDLLAITAGDQIVVDGQIVGEGRISVDESLLTGETDPIMKVTGDQVSSGSFCVVGAAYYEAQKVGAESTAGRLTEGARSFRAVRSPLQQNIASVLQVLLLVAGYLLIALLIVTFVARIPLVTVVQTATVITGLVPNGLLLAISVAYALSAVRLANKGVLIQQANAVESLSNVDVFCLDKTGTLTANRLELREVAPLTIDADEARALLGAYAASVSAPNATSQAILAACPAPARPLAVEVPFSSARKWSALAFSYSLTEQTYVLGAPEMIGPFLTAQPGLDAQIRERTDKGLRVLLFARADVPIAADGNNDDAQLQPGLSPLALLSIGDELRPEACETLQQFIAAGVEPKVISGDNPRTVAALARQAGLPGDLHVVSGVDLAAMHDDAFARTVRETTVFGRITPQQKQRIVATLREQGRYVAMTGDGVNDVLSLKEANLGIAMQSGSQATRAVADMVLLNDSFAAIPHAVQEGQRVVNGMESILKLNLARMVNTALFIMLAAAVFPLTPRQGSLFALLAVGAPSLALAAWARPGLIDRAGLGRRVLRFVLPAALTTSLFALLVYSSTIMFASAEFSNGGATLAFARSTVTIFLIVCGLLLVLFAEPPNAWWTGAEELTGDWRILAMVIGLLVILVALPWINPPLIGNLGMLFEIQPLSLTAWAIGGGVTLIWTLVLRAVWRSRFVNKMIGL